MFEQSLVGVPLFVIPDRLAVEEVILLLIFLGIWVWIHFHKARNESRQTYTALATLIQHSHPQTKKHLQRVSNRATQLAVALGLSRKRSIQVGFAALLHDVGKIAIDERILDKPAKLTNEEREIVKAHSEFGAFILRPIKDARTFSKWIHLHHERFDGSGYPIGLKGQSIPIESRIIAVVDAFDAMTGEDSDGPSRAYRDPISVDDAVLEIQRCSGTQFCPEVVRHFSRLMEDDSWIRTL